MKTSLFRFIAVVLFFGVLAGMSRAAAPTSLAELVTIDMAKSRVVSLMKRGGAPRTLSVERPKDGWEAKGSQQATLSTYAKNAEDRLNTYIEYAEVYTVKETAAGKEELYVFYNGDERVRFMLVLETKK